MNTRRLHSSRRLPSGAAFLLLVVALVLVIGAATFQMVKSEWVVRSGLSQQGRAATMQRAIDAAQATVESTAEPVQLPIDQQQWIIVRSESADGSSRIVAEWIRDGATIDSMTIHDPATQ